MYIYIYMYVCMYVYIYVHIYIYVSICTVVRAKHVNSGPVRCRLSCAAACMYI